MMVYNGVQWRDYFHVFQAVIETRLLKASSHKLVKQSHTVVYDRRQIEKVELGTTFPIVAASLRSLRAYMNKIGDCLPFLCELALTNQSSRFQNVIL